MSKKAVEEVIEAEDIPNGDDPGAVAAHAARGDELFTQGVAEAEAALGGLNLRKERAKLEADKAAFEQEKARFAEAAGQVEAAAG